MAGILDIPPFAPSGIAQSFFDVFFEVEAGGQILHNHDAKRVQSTISHKPPAQGEAYVWTGSDELFDESHNLSGISIISIIHVPNPNPPPPPPPTPTPTPVPPTPTVIPSLGGWGLLVMAAALAALATVVRRRTARES